MSAQRTSNSNARKLVNGLTEFEGSNCFAEIYPPRNEGVKTPRAVLYSDRPTWLYVVYSYGFHFPMYVAEWLEGESSDKATWYENSDKYSQSTTRQQSNTRPNKPTIKMDTEQMRQLARYGIVGVVVQPQNNTSTRLTPEEINKAIHSIANSKYAERLQAW